MVDAKILIALLGSIVTLIIFMLGIAFKTGHTSARVEELERWRGGVRLDMHEISDKLQFISNQMTELKTLVEERTERREGKRIT